MSQTISTLHSCLLIHKYLFLPLNSISLDFNSMIVSYIHLPLLLATASDILEQAKEVAAPFQNTTSAEVDVTSDSSLSSLITGHDLVIRSDSLPPFQPMCYTQHFPCVQLQGKNSSD